MVNSRIMSKNDTTANWNAAIGFIPLKGEIIIYNDYKQIEENGQTKKIPGVKIGDGLAYVQDLPFVDDELREKLIEHIENVNLHVTLGEKAFWSNKINVDDAYEAVHDELEGETLVLTRN